MVSVSFKSYPELFDSGDPLLVGCVCCNFGVHLISQGDQVFELFHLLIRHLLGQSHNFGRDPIDLSLAASQGVCTVVPLVRHHNIVALLGPRVIFQHGD